MNKRTTRKGHNEDEIPMKIEDYPEQVPHKSQYSATEIAVIYQVSQRTACHMIDDGHLRGHKIPGSRQRRVPYESIMEHVGLNPSFAYVLGRIGPKPKH